LTWNIISIAHVKPLMASWSRVSQPVPGATALTNSSAMVEPASSQCIVFERTALR
jgi:hypothetical protein